MKQIKTKTIGEAWIQACKHILEKGKLIKDGEEDLKESLNLLVTVKKSLQEDKILEKYADKEAIKWMLSNFLEQKTVPELKDALSYGTRLFNYKGKNQVQWVIEKLKKKPESKAATITMLMPEDEAYIPCVSVLDFKIRNKKLMLSALCRAIDFGSKVYANLLALNKIQEIIAKELGIKIGELNFYSVSAHIYSKNFEEINKILKEIENDRNN